jgi:hypothetical protein
MLPWYAIVGAENFVLAAIVGVILAAGLAPFLAPGIHPLRAYATTLVVVWLALAAVMDTAVILYTPH